MFLRLDWLRVKDMNALSHLAASSCFLVSRCCNPHCDPRGQTMSLAGLCSKQNLPLLEPALGCCWDPVPPDGPEDLP